MGRGWVISAPQPRAFVIPRQIHLDRSRTERAESKRSQSRTVDPMLLNISVLLLAGPWKQRIQDALDGGGKAQSLAVGIYLAMVVAVEVGLPRSQKMLVSSFICLYPGWDGHLLNPALANSAKWAGYWMSRTPQSVSLGLGLQMHACYHIWSFLKKSGFLFICVWVFCLHIYICTLCASGAHRYQKRALDTQELVWAVMWVLEAKPGSSSRAARFLTTELSLQPSNADF